MIYPEGNVFYIPSYQESNCQEPISYLLRTKGAIIFQNDNFINQNGWEVNDFSSLGKTVPLSDSILIRSINKLMFHEGKYAYIQSL